MTLPNDFQFSQNNLQDYADCARRFELRYLLHQQWPALRSEPVLEMEKHMQQGERFHRMVHQHILGIPLGTIAPTEQDLQRWWDNFEIQQPLEGLPPQRYPEYFMGAAFGGYRLVAQYDLIAIQPGERAVIMDWKTSFKRPKSSGLLHRWQSRIYPLLLTLAGAHLNGSAPIPPNKIQMIYWFTDFPNEPEVINYTQKQFNADQQQLISVIQCIQATPPGQFILTNDDKRCLFCNFRSLCNTGVTAGDWREQEADSEPATNAPLEINLDQIGEIEF